MSVTISPPGRARWEIRPRLGRIGAGMERSVGEEGVAELLEGPSLLITDGFGGHAPLLGDLRRGLALEGGVDQRRLARGERPEDGLAERLLEVVVGPVGPPVRRRLGLGGVVERLE